MASITVDNQDLLEIQRTIKTFKGSKTVIVRATNDALSGVKTEAARLIGLKITPSAKIIKEHFGLKKMTVGSMSADINCTGKPLPLKFYSATKVKKAWGPNAGVSVKVLKANKKTIIKHAFIATMKSGHEGVFWRVQLYNQAFRPGYNYGLFKEFYGNPKNPFRYIHELYGPPISEVFDDDDIIKPTLANANIRLQDRLNYHTNQLLESAR